jgi:hypothetical protein
MKTAILPHHAIQESMDRTQAERMDQYTLWQILGIWALVTLPMALRDMLPSILQLVQVCLHEPCEPA